MEIIIRRCVPADSVGTKNNRLLLTFLIIGIYALTGFLIPSSAYAKSPMLVIRIDGKDFEQAVRGLRQETEEDFFITEMIVTRHTTVSEIAGKIKIVSPKLVVLMDNIAISLYKKYQASSEISLPCVCLMASFMDIAVKDMKNVTGIFYEVPIVTSVVNLRTIMPEKQFRKIGVIFREFMTESVRTNQAYCKKERIELTAYPILSRGDVESSLKKGLKLLDIKENIDALWIPNDSMLINAELLKNVWMPFADEFKKPIIVGVEVLVNPKLNFGTFAVIPDHVELGVQAAEMVYDIMENNWKAGDKGVIQPRSVYKILNLAQAERLFNVGKEQLNFVDKILK